MQFASLVQTMVCKTGVGAILHPWFVVVGAMRAARRPPGALAVVPASLHPLYTADDRCRWLLLHTVCAMHTALCVRECPAWLWCQRTGAVVRGRELREEHRAATPVCMRRHTRESVVAAQPPRTRSTRIDARHPPDAPGFPTCSVQRECSEREDLFIERTTPQAPTKPNTRKPARLAIV